MHNASYFPLTEAFIRLKCECVAEFSIYLNHFYLQDSRAYGWKVPEGIEHDWETMRVAVQNHIKSVNWVSRVQLRDKYDLFYLYFIVRIK